MGRSSQSGESRRSSRRAWWRTWRRRRTTWSFGETFTTGRSVRSLPKFWVYSEPGGATGGAFGNVVCSHVEDAFYGSNMPTCAKCQQVCNEDGKSVLGWMDPHAPAKWWRIFLQRNAVHTNRTDVVWRMSVVDVVQENGALCSFLLRMLVVLVEVVLLLILAQDPSPIWCIHSHPSRGWIKPWCWNRWAPPAKCRAFFATLTEQNVVWGRGGGLHVSFLRLMR